MSQRGLRRMQFGKEVTAGTPVTATALWRGETDGIEDGREWTEVPEDIGIIQQSGRGYFGREYGTVKVPEAPVTFQQAMYPFEGGIAKVTTGVADGAGSGKIYTYNFSQTSANTLQPFTINAGDDQAAEKLAGSYCEEINFKGEEGQALMWDHTWFGRYIDTVSFATLTPPTVGEVLFLNGRLYIDSAMANWGTTQVSNTLIKMGVKIKTGLMPRWTADGSLRHSGVRVGPASIEASLTFEHNASARSEIAAWRAGTWRAIQLQFEGLALTTGGAIYQKEALLLNLNGKWQKFGVLEEQDGNDLVTGTFKCYTNPADSNAFARFIVVNEVSAVP